MPIFGVYSGNSHSIWSINLNGPVRASCRAHGTPREQIVRYIFAIESGGAMYVDLHVCARCTSTGTHSHFQESFLPQFPQEEK